MLTSQSEIIQRVRSFVQENFLYMQSNFQLAEDDRLLEKGVDSMSVVEIISFVKREFGLSTATEDITEANFGSLAGIARFVSDRQAGAAA